MKRYEAFDPNLCGDKEPKDPSTLGDAVDLYTRLTGGLVDIHRWANPDDNDDYIEVIVPRDKVVDTDYTIQMTTDEEGSDPVTLVHLGKVSSEGALRTLIETQFGEIPGPN